MTDLEIMQRAKMYMDQLAQGIDPISGQEIPDDSTLNNVRLARCFFYVSGILQQVIDNGGRVSDKKPFAITPEQLQAVRLSQEPLRINQIAERINEAALEKGMRKLSGTQLANWLFTKGFLEKRTDAEGKNSRVPTAEGCRIGMTTQMRQGLNGDYLAVLYDMQAQRFILDNLMVILSEK